MKSWADHCSSDEESDDDRIAPPPSGLPGTMPHQELLGLNDDGDDDDDDDDIDGGASNSNNNNNYYNSHANPLPKDYSFVFQSAPPYTAYIGNLNYDIRNSNEFKMEMEKLLLDRDCQWSSPTTNDDGDNTDTALAAVTVQSARLMTERNSGQSRGYGYVEFRTPEEVRYNIVC